MHKQQTKSNWVRRGIYCALLAGVLVVFIALFSNVAQAASEQLDAYAAESWKEATSKALSGSSQTYAYANSSEASLQANTSSSDAFDGLPAKYDLRDPNSDGDRSDSVVTPVKLQNPWGTCWAFSICAASESSILSKAGKSYAEQNIDLSELQLANSIYLNGGAPKSVVGQAQAGEGFHIDTIDPNIGLDEGGYTFYGSSIFSSGIGPVSESAAPYKNKEGLIECNLFEEGSEEPKKLYLTEDEIKKYEDSGANIVRLNWAGNYDDESGKKVFPDWSSSIDLWNASALNLQEGNVLPETAIMVDGEYDHTDLQAVASIKREMSEYGRAVACAFTAFEGYYNPDNACYYNVDANKASHAVCIVGWDDNFSKTNFNDGSSYIPPDDGAWLIKNSYGSELEDFPNYGTFGIKEDDKYTGYFWVSYYDKSITNFETFDYDLNSYGDNTEYYIDQYDYLVSDKTICNSYDSSASSANIFAADGDMCLRTLGCTTFKPNTTVFYQIYLLDNEASTPTDPNHSKLAYSFEDTYQYGGYHRATIAEDSWIAMRANQRYAIVTTQYCNDDQKWYQGVDTNSAKANFEARLNAGESWTSVSQFASGEGAGDEDASADGASAETASSQTVGSQTASTDATGTEAQTASSTQGANEQTSWTDWTVIAAAMKEKDSDLQVDNLSIKGFGEICSWASVDELLALEQAIKNAQTILENTVISKDGSDVAEGVAWMTQEQKDALIAAIEAAQAKLDLAGSDYKNTLVNTTPTSAEVVDATNALKYELSYGSGSGSGSSSKITSDSLPTTADAAAGAIVFLACIIAAAGLIIFKSICFAKKYEE